jgi:sugar O-acyltransferase (sialic acid O-acetyltransferase NeuD family)
VNAPIDRPQLFVYGAGYHTQVVIETIRRQARYDIVGLLDDDPDKTGQTVLGIPILGGKDELPALLAAGVHFCFVAVGDNGDRRQIQKELAHLGFESVCVVDPTAIVLSEVAIGRGTLVLDHSHVGVGSSLGEGCLVSVGTVVGHDCSLGDYVHLTPGVLLGGHVRVGEESFVGLGASVLPGVTVGQRVTVGAGTVVIRDLPDDVVVAGVPARILPFSPRGEVS